MRQVFLIFLIVLSGFLSQTAHSQSTSFDSYYQFLQQNPQILAASSLTQNLSTGPLANLFQSSLESLAKTGRLPAADPQEYARADALIKSGLDPRSDYFLTRNLAFSLWLELNKKVSWSLKNYSQTQLQLILNYSNRPELRGYYRLFVTPDLAFNDWQNMVVKGQSLSRRDTVIRMAQWIRDTIGHHAGEYLPSDLSAFFRMTFPGADNLNLVGSCQNNNRFMAALGSALNIPVYYTTYGYDMPLAATHNFIDFPSEDLALSHSDDLFRYNYLGQAPVSMVFLSGPERAFYLQNADLFLGTKYPAARPLEADKIFETRFAKILFQFPSPDVNRAACGGVEGMMSYFAAKNGRAFTYPDEVRKYFYQYEARLKAQCVK